MIEKSLRELSWDATEEEYRKRKYLSYSLLAEFWREGPGAIKKWLDGEKEESRYLTSGSILDKVLFDGPKGVRERYGFISSQVNPPDSVKEILKSLCNAFGATKKNLSEISDSQILMAADMAEYQTRWKPETRVNKIREEGNTYYEELRRNTGKEIVTREEYENILEASKIISTHPFTSEWIGRTPLDPENTEFLDQVKFVESFPGIGPVKIMPDRLIVNHKDQTITPVDLKSTGKREEDFEEAVIKWGYYIQATLYSGVLRSIISRDNYFSGFTIQPFRFVVINLELKTPVTWEFRSNLNSNGFTTLGGRPLPGWKTLAQEAEWHIKNHEFGYSKLTHDSVGQRVISNLLPL